VNEVWENVHFWVNYPFKCVVNCEVDTSDPWGLIPLQTRQVKASLSCDACCMLTWFLSLVASVVSSRSLTATPPTPPQSFPKCPAIQSLLPYTDRHTHTHTQYISVVPDHIPGCPPTLHILHVSSNTPD